MLPASAKQQFMTRARYAMDAETIAKALGGSKAGSGWMARCPAHDDCKPSLSIRQGKDGKVLVHCHAGCPQKQVIAELEALGLWGVNAPRSLSSMARYTHGERNPNQGDGKRSQVPLAI